MIFVDLNLIKLIWADFIWFLKLFFNRQRCAENRSHPTKYKRVLADFYLIAADLNSLARKLKWDIFDDSAPPFWSFRTSNFAPPKSTDVKFSKRRKWPNYHAYVVYESNTDNLLTCPPPPLGFSLWLSYEASNLKTIIQMIAACLLWLWLLLPAHDFPHHPRISDIKMWAAIWRPSKVPQAKSLSDPPTACELHHTAIENPPATH